MGTLTIRTDKQDEAAIEELKALFGEASASKAILQAVRRFKQLKESDADFSRRLKEAEQKLQRVENHFAVINMHKNQLAKEMGFDFIY